MDKLNFYIADLEYVEYLKKSEQTKRGFSRVPNMDYDDNHKMKFLCGIVLQVNNMNYYVPVSSYKNQKPDNFLIKSDNGKVVSSLRFNYMFPVPEAVISERCIKHRSFEGCNLKKQYPQCSVSGKVDKFYCRQCR